MAHISGKAGQVDAAAEVIGIKSWTLDYTADTLETTDFADGGVKPYVIGGTGWSGSFEGYKNQAPLPIAGADVALKLWELEPAGPFWLGQAFIVGIHANTSNDGVITYAYDFQGTGGLTVAAA